MNKRLLDPVTRGLIGLLALCAVLLPAARAGAAAQLRWIQSGSGVAGYRIHFGPVSGNYTTHVDIGLVTPGRDGIYSYPLQGLITSPSYVTMTAYSSEGLESDYSNEIWVEPPAGCRSAADCSAPSQCQSAFCDSVLGCGAQNLPDGTACDDGDPATLGERCTAGACVAPTQAPPPNPGSVDLLSIMPSMASGVVGDPVTFVVDATSSGSPMFRWLVKLGDGNWTVLRDYTFLPMLRWTPQTPGAYSVAVSAKTVGAPQEQDWLMTPFVVEAAAGSGVRFTVDDPDPADAVPQRVPIVLEAQGGPGQEYRFLLFYRGRPWRLLRHFSSDPTFVWLPLVRPGTYEIGVEVRNAGEHQPFGADMGSIDVVQAPLVECAARAGVVTCNTPPAGGELEYQWWVAGPRTRWQVLHGFGQMGDTVSFTPASGAGRYLVGVWARAAAGSQLAQRYGQRLIYTGQTAVTP